MWTTNVDGEQQRRDSQYRFGMAENGVERGGGFGRGGDEVKNFVGIFQKFFQNFSKNFQKNF